MPLFEYACKGCGQHFEAFVTAARPAVCPECQGADLQKLLSSPGKSGRRGAPRERSHSRVWRAGRPLRLFARDLRQLSDLVTS